MDYHAEILEKDTHAIVNKNVLLLKFTVHGERPQLEKAT